MVRHDSIRYRFSYSAIRYLPIPQKIIRYDLIRYRSILIDISIWSYYTYFKQPSTFLLTHKCNQNILSEFIHPCSKKRRRAQFSIRAELTRLSGCVCFRCVRGKLLTQLRDCSWASYRLSSCLRADLISSPDTWDWTRMHVLAVMHRWTLYENVDSVQITVPFYTTYIDILRVASMHRIVIHCIDISMNRYTPNTQLDYNWNGSWCKSESEGCVLNVCVCVYVYINLHCNIISVLIFFVSPWEFENPWYTVYVNRICKAIDGYFFSRVLLMFAWWQVVDLVIILQ